MYKVVSTPQSMFRVEDKSSGNVLEFYTKGYAEGVVFLLNSHLSFEAVKSSHLGAAVPHHSAG